LAGPYESLDDYSSSSEVGKLAHGPGASLQSGVRLSRAVMQGHLFPHAAF